MAAEMTVLTPEMDGCSKTLKWEKSNQLGFTGMQVYETNGGTAHWVEKSQIGLARISVWMTISEEGSENATINFITEHNSKTVELSFAEGNSGWKEICLLPISGIGVDVTFKGGEEGKSYLSAIKIEYIDVVLNSKLASRTLAMDNHIIFGSYATVAYHNRQRVDMKLIPRLEENNAYISKDAFFSFYDEDVIEKDGEITFKLGENTFSGKIGADTYLLNNKTCSGCITKSFDGNIMINIAELERKNGNWVFVSKRGLVIISDKEYDITDKNDKTEIMSILSDVRNEKI